MKLLQLQKKLNEEGLSLIANRQGKIYTSKLHGIGPIINPMKDDFYYFEEAIVVDKVIGKATAMLLILSKVKYIYAYVLSEKAKEILDQYQVDYDYEKLVPYIINRTHDRMCPMEQTVYNLTNLNEAYEALKQKQKELMKGDSRMKSKVFMTREITPEKVLEMYQLLGKKLTGKIAVKLHSGEAGNQNFLRPEFFKPIIDEVGGTVVECNTAYDGERNETKKHWKTIQNHGWTKYFDVDLLDEEGPDLKLDIPQGHVIHKNYVGNHLARYDSMLVLSHFKGHPMGGYGGALKQLSIGCASSYGKAYIHGAGDREKIWTADHDSFLESMADAAMSVHQYFQDNIVYINIMKNMSVDCDCVADAEDPCMEDIGILISTDPIAIDQACIDLVYQSDDPGKEHLIERIESRNGIHTIEAAAQLNFGCREYELIEVK